MHAWLQGDLAGEVRRLRKGAATILCVGSLPVLQVRSAGTTAVRGDEIQISQLNLRASRS